MHVAVAGWRSFAPLTPTSRYSRGGPPARRGIVPPVSEESELHRQLFERARRAVGLPDVVADAFDPFRGSRCARHARQQTSRAHESDDDDRYLNLHRRALYAVLKQLEQHRPAVAQPLHRDANDAQAGVPTPEMSAPSETSRLQ